MKARRERKLLYIITKLQKKGLKINNRSHKTNKIFDIKIICTHIIIHFCYLCELFHSK